MMNVDMNGFQFAEQAEDVQLSVPLPADMMAALRVAVFQRRSLGDESAAVADLVQQAVAEWLEREIDNASRISIQI